MGNVLNEFVETLVGGISGIAKGIGDGVNQFVGDLFLNTAGSETTLSTFGGVVAVFGGVGLAIGLTTLIFNWIRSIGNH